MRQIKEQFTQVLQRRNKKRILLSKKRGELKNLKNSVLFTETSAQQAKRKAKILKLTTEVDKKQAEIDKYEQGVLFRDAFEWRFEFPEVLDNKGIFSGFDVVIGNPPYIRADEQDLNQRRAILASKRFETLSENWDLYVAFLELGHHLLKEGGLMSMIIPDAYGLAKYAATSHSFFLQHSTLLRLDFFRGFQVFEEAAVGSFIPFIEKTQPAKKHIPERRLHLSKFDAVSSLRTTFQNDLIQRLFFIDPPTDSLMLRSQFGQRVVHGFESAQIKLGFKAKMADA